MGNSGSSSISQRVDETKWKLRLAQHIRTYSRLESDVKLLSLICRHSFIDPRTQTCMQFSIWTKLSHNELLIPMLWRAEDAVLIQVDWKQADQEEHSVSLTDDEHAAEYSEYKSNTTIVAPRVLTVSDFYVLFMYVQSHRELIVQAQNRLKAMRSQVEQPPTDARFTHDHDIDDSTCSICLNRAVDSVLACTHGMCSSCLREWRETSQSELAAECPFCRTQMEDEDEDWEVTPQSSEEILNQLQSVAVHANSIAIERGRLVDQIVADKQSAEPQRQNDGI